ncbi:MAG: hypothetical protein KJ939_06320 [Nanoarchaeota archaeon]|nr:hypothetical protein [Nanoarchaeota archaeon]MCG2719703.1 hypothetical protein [Nanoarchaeota archaeon]
MEIYSEKTILVPERINNIFAPGINMIIGPNCSGKTIFLRQILLGKQIHQVSADCDPRLSKGEKYFLDVEKAISESGSSSSIILDDFGSRLTMENIAKLMEKAKEKNVQVIATVKDKDILKFADKAIFLECGQIKLMHEFNKNP